MLDFKGCVGILDGSRDRFGGRAKGGYKHLNMGMECLQTIEKSSVVHATPGGGGSDLGLWGCLLSRRKSPLAFRTGSGASHMC